jgi:hypothetical protein
MHKNEPSCTFQHSNARGQTTRISMAIPQSINVLHWTLKQSYVYPRRPHLKRKITKTTTLTYLQQAIQEQ